MNNSTQEGIPQALSSEKYVLSLMFQSDDDKSYTSEILGAGITAENFFSPGHKFLFEHIAARYRDGKFCDLVGLAQELDLMGRLKEVGGASYVTEIFTFVPSGAHLTEHIDKLKTYKAKRDALAATEKLSELAYDHQSSTESITNALRIAQETLAGSVTGIDDLKSSKEACGLFMSHFESLVRNGGFPGQETGIRAIDEVTGGLRPHDMMVIAGKPSDGKSVLMLQIANNFLKMGKKVLVFSLEMGREEVISRAISYIGGVHGDYLTRPNGTDKGTLIKMKKAITLLQDSNLKINDQGGQTMDTIETQALMERDANGVDLIVIDYIQIVSFDGKRMSKTEGVEDTSGRMKQLAKKLNCPVVTGSQLNDDGRLKAARKIGEDANIVLTITEKGLFVDKNRNGRRGDCLNLHHIQGMNKFEPINDERQY